MFALVRLTDFSLVQVPHEPLRPADPAGCSWWPLDPQVPPHDRRTQVPVPGDLYADQNTETVRRLYSIRAKTQLELAQMRSESALKRLGVSDPGMVRALEDLVLFFMQRLNLSLDDLEKELPDAVRKIRERQGWRNQLK